MGISIRAYARHRGVSHVAVKKAIDTGRMTLEPDGSIDAAKADRQWAANTAMPRSAAPAPSSTASTASTQARPRAVATTAQRQEDEAPATSGGTTMLAARTANEVLKVQAGKVRLARLKGELVDRNQAIAHVFKLARSERDAWLNWPARASAQLAARLNADPHTVHVALEAAVREHLQELGELRPRVD